MAKRGRPVQGANLVESAAAGGSAMAKLRLKVILRTLAGESTVEEACKALSIGRSAFNKLRSQFLNKAAGLLEPRPPGRKKRVHITDEHELRRLRDENATLRIQRHAHAIREEIAVAMPFLLKPRTPADSASKKKTPPSRPGRASLNSKRPMP